MGSLEKISRPQDTHTASLIPPDHIAAWLDGLLTNLTANPTDWQIEEIHKRLAGIPFDAIISAIDRAGPRLDDLGQAGLYHHWISANPGGPLIWAAWFNIGTIFSKLKNTADAATAYRNALLLRPDMHMSAINLGLIHETNGEPDLALAIWGHALQTDEARNQLKIQQGRLQEKIGRFRDAEQTLRDVLLTNPAQPDVLHHWVHLRQKTCTWPVLADIIPGLPPPDILHGSGPFGIMALTDDIAIQSACAAAWVARKTEPAPTRLAPAAPYGHERIRIGYVSSDFCRHAMSYLITELFERHDRTRFEIFGYCASVEDGSDLRRRVLAAFDHHRIIRDLSDEDAAKIIRADEIDFLVELNGITDGSRLAMLRWRPAPIQATYLGFIGPLPMPELDYILCDRIAIPPEHESAYAPTPLPVGPIYQANDSKRTIGRETSRAEAGLPEDRFILCGFTKHYKITQEMFGAWLEILQRAPNTVLWLAQDNEYSKANLLATAARAGIDDSRIIISERADPDLYMSRLKLPDLFIDTFPYNAGTVASDAIRMGLPIVTLCGNAFASRMATSLLTGLGTTEGIATNLPAYIAKIVRYATDPAAHARYKAHFTPDAWAASLGNITVFTKHYEDTVARVVATRAAQPATPLPPAPPAPTALVLHAGGTGALPAYFSDPTWFPIRLHPDAALTPHIIAPLTAMTAIGTGQVSAVHADISGLPATDLPAACAELLRVTNPPGLASIRADLPEAELATLLLAAGFGFIITQPGCAIAWPAAPDALALTRAQAGLLPDPTQPANIFRAPAPPPVEPASEPTAPPAALEATPPDPTPQNAADSTRDPRLEQALALHHAGRYEEAEPLYQELLASPSASAESCYSFAMLCHVQNRLGEAESAYRRAIATAPSFPDPYINLGTALITLGRAAEALEFLGIATALAPDSALAHANLGKALHDTGKIDEAIALYDTALRLGPDNPDTLNNLGAAFLAKNDYESAAAALQRAVELRPDAAMSFANLGNALLNLGRYNEALAACQAAAALNPQGAKFQASLGGAMLELGQFEAAAKFCASAIALDPAHAAAHFNLSHAHKALGHLEDAESAVRAAIALLPDDADYHFHLAHTLLVKGDLEAGWRDYEWRFKLPDFQWVKTIPAIAQTPRWSGEDIADKTLLIHTEQGLGDIIQFARYIPLTAAKAKRVIVACTPPTQRLLSSIPGVTIIPFGEPIPPVDVQCPIMSLPIAFATRIDNIPAAVPYLAAPPEALARWHRPPAPETLRVGIVWAGNPKVQRDRFRSPGLPSVTPLFAVPGVELTVLQLGPGRTAWDANPPPPNVIDPGPDISDLTDTAAIMAGLDLVISSCTAPLHLAGALGLPAWGIIPFAPHFTWLTEREDCPWYPSIRLYRQDSPGRDWASVIERICTDLAALAKAKKDRVRKMAAKASGTTRARKTAPPPPAAELPPPTPPQKTAEEISWPEP